MPQKKSSPPAYHREVQFDFVRSAGPGGQNVNKVATAVQLRFDVAHNTSLPTEVKARLIKLAGKRITTEGVLIIEARQYRTQDQNRTAALGRLDELVRRAKEKPKSRKKTAPTRASKERRISAKKTRGEIKRGRTKQSTHWE